MNYFTFFGGFMILLIEDNNEIIDGILYKFKNNKYDLKVSKTLKDINLDNINLIILDVSMPDGNGFDFYKNYIKGNIKTIFLTAKDEEIDIITGLNLGAEDYITKPFYTSELLLRVDRLLNKNKVIKKDNVTFDLEKQEVYKDNVLINFTTLELKILSLLFININKTVKRETLLEKIWEYTGNDVDDHTITVYIKRIKDKLGVDIIKTIKGIGYRIDE